MRLIAWLTLALFAVLTACADSSPEPPAEEPEAGPTSGDEAGTESVCEPGADQSCNDDPAISSLHGTCKPDGTCECTTEKNAATGRCL